MRKKRAGFILKSEDDIKRINESGLILARIFQEIYKMSLDGMSTWEIDSFIDSMLVKNKARAAFKTVNNYNFATCISINNEVVHGIPSKKKKVKTGDIVKIDAGAVLNGYFSDACKSFPVGDVSPNADRLIRTTKEALYKAIDEMYPGNYLGDLGYAVENYVTKYGYSVVRDFAGHGIGFKLHESPSVAHYGKKNTGLRLLEGVVLAVEPMVNEGKPGIVFCKDGWTTQTVDGMLSAHYEHTIAVTKNGPLILTK